MSNNIIKIILSVFFSSIPVDFDNPNFNVISNNSGHHLSNSSLPRESVLFNFDPLFGKTSPVLQEINRTQVVTTHHSEKSVEESVEDECNKTSVQLVSLDTTVVVGDQENPFFSSPENTSLNSSNKSIPRESILVSSDPIRDNKEEIDRSSLQHLDDTQHQQHEILKNDNSDYKKTTNTEIISLDTTIIVAAADQKNQLVSSLEQHSKTFDTDESLENEFGKSETEVS